MAVSGSPETNSEKFGCRNRKSWFRRRVFKKLALGLLLVFIAAQFFRPEKNLSPSAGAADIAAAHAVPPAVRDVLHRACYDCHSNQTNYPWYAEIQPVAWWLADHVKDGKEHLNFSEFGTYSVKRASNKLDQIYDEVSQHSMPLKSYTWGHPEARLTPAEVKLLIDWAEELRDEIAPE